MNYKSRLLRTIGTFYVKLTTISKHVSCIPGGRTVFLLFSLRVLLHCQTA